MTILEYMKDNIVYLDGGMGTLLQAAGLEPGELPERWNLTHPEVVQRLQKEYFDAGSNVINTNTFGANSLVFSHEELAKIVKAAVANAKAAKAASSGKQEKFIALDIGPCGKLLKPYGDLDFEDAVALFAEIVRVGTAEGVDLVFIETMSDSYETKAALLAAKENCSLPVFVSNAYGEDGKLLTGASPEAMVALAEAMGADAVGANCSMGPKQLAGVVSRILQRASVPVILKPNAGLPQDVEGEAVYDVTPASFAAELIPSVKEGARLIGGCCGTTPEYIKEIVAASAGLSPVPVSEKNITCISSYTHTVDFGERPVLIGERINPTGKKRFRRALQENDIDYILQEGIGQQEAGVHVLDVNVGLPEIDEAAMLKTATCELQAIIDLPLQLDTADEAAMEAALRRYNGKALINSVSGKQESMEKIFPLVKKYGGAVIALTLDDEGIPSDAEARVKIAEKILAKAAEYGIKPKDVIFDTLAMTVSADTSSAETTLAALREIRERLGCHTSLGVSNISFGLPGRDGINSAFFAMAMENGLSAAIMNPYSSDMMKTYRAFCALKGLDENCADYIAFAEAHPEAFARGSGTAAAGSAANAAGAETAARGAAASSAKEAAASPLRRAVVKGLKEQAAQLTRELLADAEPLSLIKEELIPALDIVGKGFEEKTVYLPQLLMSAEAAKAAFEVIKEAVESGRAAGAGAGGGAQTEEKATVVIATVEGDIHDIGKNIVRLLLDNYGFKVIDLGKDVPPEEILAAVTEHHADVAGLSALMTTTVPAMERTIRLLSEKAPWCKVVVGGAVLNEEYASRIGAGKYAGDAMETVRFADSVRP